MSTEVSSTIPEDEDFMNFTEIVNDILHHLHAKDRTLIESLKKEDLIRDHSYWGQHIRNFYRLWDPQNPLTLKDYSPILVRLENGVTIDANPKHPDAVSFKIIEAVWDALHYPEYPPQPPAIAC
jgi:hypothetical protein